MIDLDELLGRLMDVIHEVFRPERGALFLSDSRTGELAPSIFRPEGQAFAVSGTVLNHAIEKRESLLIADVQLDDRFSGAQSIVAQAILSAICSPLICKDRILGALYIDTQSHKLTYKKEDLALLNIVAANAAIAIENAILVQQKVEAERLAAMGVAVAGISHYVKNVIFGIKGSMSLIEQSLDRNDMQTISKIFPVLKRSSDKMSTLVQDMLTYSKKREPEWEPGNLNHLLQEIYDDQLARSSEAHVALALETDPAVPDSQYDHKALHDTVLNIVGNAIEACADRPDAQVLIQSRYDSGSKRIEASVKDNGPGIPAEIQKRIFDPFFSTKGSKGTGLGLAVARKTVEEHGGTLLLLSKEGSGAEFRLHLPVERPGV